MVGEHYAIRHLPDHFVEFARRDTEHNNNELTKGYPTGMCTMDWNVGISARSRSPFWSRTCFTNVVAAARRRSNRSVKPMIRSMAIGAHHPFRSAEAKQKYLQFHDKQVEKWPIPSETEMVETSFGQTFVRT